MGIIFLNKMSISAEKRAELKGELKKLGKELRCPVCLGTFLNPYGPPCGHIFCKLCIEQCHRSNGACPLCRVPFYRRQLQRSHTMFNIVDSFTNIENLVDGGALSQSQKVLPIASSQSQKNSQKSFISKGREKNIYEK